MRSTPPHEDSTNAVESVNERATEIAPDKPPEVGQPDDPDPSSAIEVLWYEVARVEAVARAARQSLESLPSVREGDPEDQRAVDRLHALVTITAEMAEGALIEAESQLARLGKHIPEHRKEEEQP